jgi:hypothetical protein
VTLPDETHPKSYVVYERERGYGIAFSTHNWFSMVYFESDPDEAVLVLTEDLELIYEYEES